MNFIEAVTDAAQTVRLLQQSGAQAKDIGRDLRCAPSWVPIEMEIRLRLKLDDLRQIPMTPMQLYAWRRAAGWP